MNEPTGASYLPISDYALIGDCHGAALVSRQGSIDWACLRRFDSGAVFCRLLDVNRGGCFSLVAREIITTSRRYLPDSNVLETTFVTSSGEARLTDCFAMRMHGRENPLRELLRRVEGVRGKVTFDVRFEPRFDYGSVHPWLRSHEKDGVFSAVGGSDAAVLFAECALALDRDNASLGGSFQVGPDERVRFALRSCLPHALDLGRVGAMTFDARLSATIRWWERWVKRAHTSGILRPEVLRSALVLKLLTCAPTGAIVAAPTTSLPEKIGAERNWDYRFSWIRDSTMTLAALLAVGHPEAAMGFKRFIENATAGRADEVQILYGCYGERRISEVSIDGLQGYRGSRPVRVGNAAVTQTQLDVYGEIVDAAHLWRQAGSQLNQDGWRLIKAVVDMAAARWREPDRGIWESRGEPRHFVYSKVMCWLALARGIALAERDELAGDLGIDRDLDRWRSTRDEIRKSVESEGIDVKRGCFVQAYGSKELDASLLRLPALGFVKADDPRMRATVAAIREDLAVGNLIRRYRTSPDSDHDGLKGGEGVFLMASFWLVDVLAADGRVDEAESIYAELVALGNDVGLFAEEHDPATSEMLGNFPQAFTHVALIHAAEQIHRAKDGHAADQSLAERHYIGALTRATAHHRSPTG